MGSVKYTTEKALELLRFLPRVQIGNIRNNPNSKQLNKRGRAQHGKKIKILYIFDDFIF